MVIRDLYRLQRSELFYLAPRQDKTVDVSMRKVPPEPCTLLVGTVGGTAGPIETAVVTVYDKYFTPLTNTVTDEKGCFLFENTLPPDEYIILSTANGYNISEACSVFLSCGQPCSLCIWLEASDASLQTGVYGIVYDQSNAVLENVNIIIAKDEGMKQCVAVTKTNAFGEYFVYGLNEGAYWISAYKEGYLLPQKLSFEILTKEFTCVNLFLYIILSLSCGNVCGTIDSCGQGLPGAVAALFRSDNNSEFLLETKKTNGSGCYLFPNVKPGNYIIKSKKETPPESI